jgi:hypothetical protein
MLFFVIGILLIIWTVLYSSCVKIYTPASFALRGKVLAEDAAESLTPCFCNAFPPRVEGSTLLLAATIFSVTLKTSDGRLVARAESVTVPFFGTVEGA